MTVVPVILSGGSGIRLWPVSREGYPKQFWPLISRPHHAAGHRAPRATATGFAPPFMVCNQEHRFLMAEQLRDGRHRWRPHRAGAGGAQHRPRHRRRRRCWLRRADPDAVLWLLAADHAIADHLRCTRRSTIAVAAARAGRIVTFGMRPTAPETGYGYIASAPRWPMRRAPTPSRASSRSRTPPTPRDWSPAGGICGTPACSCSPRDPAR